MDQFSRTELVLGSAAVAHLKTCRVAIFGVGGVGGYAAEALVRSGVGAIDLYDDDRVCLTNLNRQLIATRKTVGQYKVDAMEQRLHDINPNVEIHTYKMFYMPDTADQVDLTQYDYVVDAVDTVTAKLELVCRAKRAGVSFSFVSFRDSIGRAYHQRDGRRQQTRSIPPPRGPYRKDERLPPRARHAHRASQA